MITKVTSANYDAYTLLFNQADTALKESYGEPTSEFLEVAEHYVECIRDYSLIFRDDENSNGVYMDPIAEVYDK